MTPLRRGITRYEIHLVNLDPTTGSEIRKTRPCVVISPDEMNRHLNLRANMEKPAPAFWNEAMTDLDRQEQVTL